MPKGIRKQRSLGEELMGMDRILLAATRRNLAFAERMARESQDPEARTALEKFISRHLLRPKPNAPTEKKPAVAPTTEKERRIQRLAGYLPDLTDWDLANLLELAKSMHRFQMAAKPRKSRPGSDGQSGIQAGPGIGETRSEPPGNG